MNSLRYPVYKATGIPWLPEVPKEWEVTKLKWVLQEIKNLSETGEELPLSLTASDGLIPFSEKKNRTMESESYVGAKIVEPGQIVFNRFKARLFAIASCKGLVSSDYAVYSLRMDINPHYLLSILKTPVFRQVMNNQASGIGDGFSRLYSSELYKLSVPTPRRDVQDKIAAFLDSKCAKIDKLMAAKTRQIELLEELKQRRISDVVTGQCKIENGKARYGSRAMKQSGIPWLPEVPDEWNMRKMKYSFTERSEKGHPNEQPLCSTQAYGVIPQSLYENRVVIVNSGFENLKFVKVGDFVISLRSFQGGIELAHYQGIISAAYTVLTPKNQSNTAYFRYLFKSPMFIRLLQTCVTGIREGQNINYKLLGRKLIPIPPRDEQCRIVSYVEQMSASIDKLTEAYSKEIELLKEYKRRLISDVVTGQRKVCDD